MIKVSDYIADYLAKAGLKHVFMLTGGGAMHLNDSLAKHPALHVIFNHHEQACAMAAESYARLTNQMAIVNVTTGPGGINALNGVFGAWTDSIPLLVLSGQVRYDTTLHSTDLPLRQLGDQEVDIVQCVNHMTKYAVMVTDPLDIKYQLQKALYLATHGRPGPVWLDIPINVQGALIDASSLRAYEPSLLDRQTPPPLPADLLPALVERIRCAERPVILAGTGVRLSKKYSDFLALIDALNIPVTTAFNAHDVVDDLHPLYVGRPGTVGDRAGNFAVQNADLLLVLGCRLNIRQISYNYASFARAAYKIMVDIDPIELKKPMLRIDEPIHADLATFMSQLLLVIKKSPLEGKPAWLAWCKTRQKKYPVVLPRYWDRTHLINPYCFIDALSTQLPAGQITVTANATACITAFQAFKIKRGQRLYSNSGSASMGYDLPAAIGACVGSGGLPIVCLAGDGSIQLNIQELATIKYHQFPIKIFVFNNGGYHSIRQTQQSYFATPLVGVDNDSGLYFPDMKKIAAAYEIDYVSCTNHFDMNNGIHRTLSTDKPTLCEVFITPEQAFEPKQSSIRLADGRMISKPLEDMSPLLSRDELKDNMLIDLLPD